MAKEPQSKALKFSQLIEIAARPDGAASAEIWQAELLVGVAVRAMSRPLGATVEGVVEAAAGLANAPAPAIARAVLRIVRETAKFEIPVFLDMIDDELGRTTRRPLAKPADPAEPTGQGGEG